MLDSHPAGHPVAPSTPAFLPRMRRTPKPRARLAALTAYGSLFAALLVWFALSHLAGLLLAAGLAPVEIAFWRLLIAGAAFALHALLRRAPRLEGADRLQAGIRLVALSAVGVSAFYLVLGLPWGAAGGLAVYTLPLALGLMLWRRQEQLSSLRRFNVLLLGVVAALLLWGGTGADLSLSTLVLPALLGATFAVWYRLSKGLLRHLTPLTLYALALPLAAACLLPVLAFAAKTPLVWLELGLFALVSSYGLHGLYYLTLSQLGAPRSVLAASAEPVAAALVALMLFAPLGPAGLLGAAVVGVALAAGMRKAGLRTSSLSAAMKRTAMPWSAVTGAYKAAYTRYTRNAHARGANVRGAHGKGACAKGAAPSPRRFGAGPGHLRPLNTQPLPNQTPEGAEGACEEAGKEVAGAAR